MNVARWEEKAKGIVFPLFCVYLAALLWITLLSRIGTNTRVVYSPFWSYREIWNGNSRVLIQNLENIILFVPFGFFAYITLPISRKGAVLVGLLMSLSIESAQWLFWLGESEIDDVINNTIGAWLGVVLAVNLQIKRIKPKRISAIIGILSLLLVICIPISSEMIRHEKMETLAKMNDREDGNRNLLVLNGRQGFVPDTNVYVSYNGDGSIAIDGNAESRSWKQIGYIWLEPGKYSFEGLENVEPYTISLEIETVIDNAHIDLTPDIGPISEAIFTVYEKTLARIYVGTYPGADSHCIARPALYRED